MCNLASYVMDFYFLVIRTGSHKIDLLQLYIINESSSQLQFWSVLTGDTLSLGILRNNVNVGDSFLTCIAFRVFFEVEQLFSCEYWFPMSLELFV